MYWKEINEQHHGKKVKVWADSTPESPKQGDLPTIGRIDCREEGAMPVLRVGNLVHTFAPWYKVEILD